MWATRTLASRVRHFARLLFPTVTFALFFPPVLLASWLLAPRPLRWKLFLLAASYVFYAWWDWRFCFLIAASTVMLLVAGTIEGFISPIETWALRWKLAVSGGTAVAMLWYLAGGRSRRRAPERRDEGGEEERVELGLQA